MDWWGGLLPLVLLGYQSCVSVCPSVSTLPQWLVPKSAWLRPRNLLKRRTACHSSASSSVRQDQSHTCLRLRGRRGQAMKSATHNSANRCFVLGHPSFCIQSFPLKLWKQRP